MSTTQVKPGDKRVKRRKTEPNEVKRKRGVETGKEAANPRPPPSLLLRSEKSQGAVKGMLALSDGAANFQAASAAPASAAPAAATRSGVRATVDEPTWNIVKCVDYKKCEGAKTKDWSATLGELNDDDYVIRVGRRKKDEKDDDEDDDFFFEEPVAIYIVKAPVAKTDGMEGTDGEVGGGRRSAHPHKSFKKKHYYVKGKKKKKTKKRK
jgi:hypothetical protein